MTEVLQQCPYYSRNLYITPVPQTPTVTHRDNATTMALTIHGEPMKRNNTYKHEDNISTPVHCVTDIEEQYSTMSYHWGDRQLRTVTRQHCLNNAQEVDNDFIHMYNLQYLL